MRSQRSWDDMASPTRPVSLPVRLWGSYLRALQTRPIRTRVITSSILFVSGDVIAQLVIEDRKVSGHGIIGQKSWDVSRGFDPSRLSHMHVH